MLKKLDVKILLYISLLGLTSFCFAEDSAVSKKIKPFEDLTENLFEAERIDSSFWASSPLPEEENKAMNGVEYLYCAIMADFLAEIKDAPKFYDKGMSLLDDYVVNHSTRDVSAYDTGKHNTFISKSIPYFHQSWLINNKDVLKGVIFNSIYDVILNKYYENDPLGRKNTNTFRTLYEKHCKTLNK